jgi:hypothetical protein
MSDDLLFGNFCFFWGDARYDSVQRFQIFLLTRGKLRIPLDVGRRVASVNPDPANQ